MKKNQMPRKKVVDVEREREDGHTFYYHRLECGHRVIIPVETRPRRPAWQWRPCHTCAYEALAAARKA